MSRHTQGPWKVINAFIVTDPEADSNGKKQPAIIAQVMRAGDEQGVWNWHCKTTADLENGANAELIAAAPELLSMCEDLFHQLSTDSDISELTGHAKYDALIDQLQAVIIKAKGELP